MTIIIDTWMVGVLFGMASLMLLLMVVDLIMAWIARYHSKRVSKLEWINKIIHDITEAGDAKIDKYTKVGEYIFKGPGETYYFEDEASQFIGPYSSEDIAIDAMEAYVDDLKRGAK